MVIVVYNLVFGIGVGDGRALQKMNATSFGASAEFARNIRTLPAQRATTDAATALKPSLTIDLV